MAGVTNEARAALQQAAERVVRADEAGRAYARVTKSEFSAREYSRLCAESRCAEDAFRQACDARVILAILAGQCLACGGVGVVQCVDDGRYYECQDCQRASPLIPETAT